MPQGECDYEIPACSLLKRPLITIFLIKESNDFFNKAVYSGGLGVTSELYDDEHILIFAVRGGYCRTRFWSLQIKRTTSFRLAAPFCT